MLVFSKANVVKLLPRRRICTQWSKLLAAHCCDCEYAQQLLQRSGPFEVSQRLRSLLVMPQEKAFREFANSTSPRRIAVSLNEEGLVGPLGRSWGGGTTIRGHVSRGTGLINNELYIGRLTWNRQRYIKDPSTGKPSTA